MKKPLTPEQRRRRRNRLQRARRASPEARAAEARASRRSYHRRTRGWGHVSSVTGRHGCASECGACISIGIEYSLCP
jgi:hypothetical protein